MFHLLQVHCLSLVEIPSHLQLYWLSIVAISHYRCIAYYQWWSPPPRGALHIVVKRYPPTLQVHYLSSVGIPSHLQVHYLFSVWFISPLMWLYRCTSYPCWGSSPVSIDYTGALPILGGVHLSTLWPNRCTAYIWWGSSLPSCDNRGALPSLDQNSTHPFLSFIVVVSTTSISPPIIGHSMVKVSAAVLL